MFFLDQINLLFFGNFSAWGCFFLILFFSSNEFLQFSFSESLYDVVAKMTDCNHVVREFELLSHYYIYVRTKILENDLNLISHLQWVQ